MSFEPNPTQALILWKMIAGTTAERDPKLSEVTPAAQRNVLIKHGFLSANKKEGSRAQFLALGDPAWEWASHAREIKFNDAPSGARVLQGLLRRLIPFLEQREIALAELFRDAAPAPASSASEGPVSQPAPVAPAPADPSARGAHAGDPLGERIERACLSLAGGAKRSRVRLSALRRELASVPRQDLDEALIGLQRERRLVLYRDDDTPALTPEDHAAALLVGDSPRHLVYLEA